MPYVVSKTQSLQFTGTNDEAIRQVLANYDYWTEDQQFSGNGIRFNGADGDSMTFAPGDYLVYGSNDVRRVSSSDYEARYREIA
ncbi:hypothetical protein SEA_KEANU_24 [Streptomyces phage Keanu]|nr:hypothetical protein SEA_KEANU_24 [Streptomyces phage Keanu]